MQPFELPADCLKVLGQTHGERINTMICDIVACSADKPKLAMSPLVQETMDGLREFMFARVYRDQWRQAEEERCKHVVEALFSYYSEHPGEMPEEFVLIGYKEGTARAVCDFCIMHDRPLRHPHLSAAVRAERVFGNITSVLRIFPLFFRRFQNTRLKQAGNFDFLAN